MVFADGAGGSASDDPAGGSGSPLKAEDTLKERLAQRDLLTTHSALRALGLEGELDTTQTSNKIRVVAPGPRGSRKPVATLDTTRSLSSLNEGGEDAYDGPEILDANRLDFREVGISTWKVKVAIGLIYDFSDIATLKRYLADKRVSPSDLLSHNGKEWTVIGDIPDLDKHFIETWKSARAALKGSSGAAGKKQQDSGGQGGGFSTSTGKMAALSPSGRHKAVRSRSKRARPRQRAAPKKASNTTSWLTGLLVLLAVGYYLTKPPDLAMPAASETSPVSQAAAPQSPQTDAEQDRIRRGVKDEVARQREKMMAEERAANELEEAEVEADESDGVRDFSKLVAVRPEEQVTAVGARGAGSVSAGTDSRASSETPGRLAPPSALGSSSGTSSVRRDDGGGMWLTQGKKALASGNYGTAKSMFQQCVNKNAGSGECWAGLGQSLQRMGESAKAEAAFDRAENLGVRVNRSTP